MEKRIRRDKERKGVVCEMRRSVMIYNIIGLLNEGAIKAEDLEGFSEELKERIFAGQIEDAKTIAALLAYEAKYLRG